MLCFCGPYGDRTQWEIFDSVLSAKRWFKLQLNALPGIRSKRLNGKSAAKGWFKIGQTMIQVTTEERRSQNPESGVSRSRSPQCRQRAGAVPSSPCSREEGASEKESGQGNQKPNRNGKGSRGSWRAGLEVLAQLRGEVVPRHNWRAGGRAVGDRKPNHIKLRRCSVKIGKEFRAEARGRYKFLYGLFVSSVFQSGLSGG